MKKTSIIIFIFSMISASLFSQSKDNAIGLRFGGGDGIGTEISFQHALKSPNRIEANLGFASNTNYNRILITGLYQWVWNIQGGLNWYAGFGGGFGHASNTNMSNGFLLNLDGNIGIEYNFDLPFQLSLDFRPSIGNTQLDNSSIGLSLRYSF